LGEFLMDMKRRKRIEECAYAFWQAEGQPHGRHDEHWRRAALQIDAEETARIAGESKERRPSKQGAAKPGRKKSKK